MSEVLMPPKPGPRGNRIGLDREAYKGGSSTLCPGCGHNAITNHIIAAYYDLGIDPYQVIKLSGIGCSSKTPAYFLQRSHGFNAVHGRMPSIATGAVLANRTLRSIGVSGDGDTASIGLGQLCHLIRRDIPILYIIENNGVYGLTKGQFSATADLGSMQKKGEINDFFPIDCCALAITLGCSFVARAFSGDGKQVVPLIKAALSHQGTALLDIVSPCVTFNDHEGSTKSYQYVKDHDLRLHDIGFVPAYEDIKVDYEPGDSTEVQMHDGSRIVLRKLDSGYVPDDRMKALQVLDENQRKGELVTGLLYVDPEKKNFIEQLEMVDRPLAGLAESALRPSRQVLEEIMESLA